MSESAPAAPAADTGTNTGSDAGIPGSGSEGQISEQSELELLKKERDELKATMKQIEQKDLSETEKEMAKLKDELHDLAKTKVLDSKLVKEKELEQFDYKELRAMGFLIDKLAKTGNKIAPPRTPEGAEQKPKIKRYFNAQKQEWE